VTGWKVAPSLEQLRNQLDELAPERSKASDGAIGDEDHRNRSSDHNPWWQLNGQRYVTARDFTHDPGGGLDCDELAAALERGRDRRVKYIIWESQICSGSERRDPWEWRDYNGPNLHTRHLHLSVVADARALLRIPWMLPDLVTRSDLTTLKRGSTGPAVRELQRVLNAWYPQMSLRVDGVFGLATEAAVRALQERSEGLVVDGVVGPRTAAVLNL
jgi:hypothetical protein